jgi:hypothetical protein
MSDTDNMAGRFSNSKKAIALFNEINEILWRCCEAIDMTPGAANAGTLHNYTHKILDLVIEQRAAALAEAQATNLRSKPDV